MKTKNSKKKAPFSKGTRKGKVFSINEDSFFRQEAKRRRVNKDEDAEDEIIESEEEEEDDEEGTASDADGGEERLVEDEFAAETADEKRLRVAKAYVEKIRGIVSREKEDEEESEGGEERGGVRDSLVAQILQQEQLEESGRVRRLIASRYMHLILTHFDYT